MPRGATALHFATRALREPLRTRLMADLDLIERMYLDELMQHEDPLEGIKSFLERPPQWKNR